MKEYHWATLLTLVLGMVSAGGCSTIQRDTGYFNIAYSNFIYTKDPKGTDPALVYTSINYPFAGDCEDFAFTLQRQIGGDVYYVLHNERGAHAVLEKNGMIYDNLNDTPMSAEEYPGFFVGIMHHNNTGLLIDNHGGQYRIVRSSPTQNTTNVTTAGRVPNRL